MKDKFNKKVADSPSVPLNCWAAVDQHETIIECAYCGVMTTLDNADFAEGDGGMIPDRWFCHRCQILKCEAADDERFDYDDDGDDWDDWDKTDPNLCEQCGGDLDVYEVCNDCDV